MNNFPNAYRLDRRDHPCPEERQFVADTALAYVKLARLRRRRNLLQTAVLVILWTAGLVLLGVEGAVPMMDDRDWWQLGQASLDRRSR